MNDSRFKVRYIKRKNKLRKLVTYDSSNEMRSIHNQIVNFLGENTRTSLFSKAYIKNQSIVKNARSHMYNDIFIMCDISKFFNNINLSKLVDILYHELNCKEHLIIKSDVQKMIDLCTVENKGLPLGLITSPILSNLYLKDFDNVIYGKLKSLQLDNLIYTRYADDMVISFRSDELDNKIIDRILKILVIRLRFYGLKLNDRKTKIIDLNKSNHVKITGINITKDSNNYRTLSVGKKRKNELFWETINYYETGQRDPQKIYYLKGMESFVLSVDGINYEKGYSENMRDILRRNGYESLHLMIKSLK